MSRRQCRQRTETRRQRILAARHQLLTKRLWPALIAGLLARVDTVIAV